jgi:mono/diheme cytochrome c family protein
MTVTPVGAAVGAIGIVVNVPADVTKDKQTMKRTILLTAMAVAAVATASAADVKENWEKNCVKCHGADGAGKTKMGEKLGVKDYTSADVQAKMKDEAMAKAIKEGVKDGDKTKMKAFGDVLNDDEIKALVKHVRTLKK